MTGKNRISPANIESLIKQLPALPTLTLELFNSFELDNIDVASLTRRLSNDQSLVARALRIANSPFYGMPSQVTSIHDAIIILGFQTVRSLVTSAAAVNALSGLCSSKTKNQTYWRHSVAVAVCGRYLAKSLSKNPEIAFTAGLLHGMGRIVLEACFPQEYEEALALARQEDLLIDQAEKEILGVTHTYTGALLAKQWGLPNMLIEAIALYKSPPDDDPKPLVDLIHVADIIAIALEISGSPAEVVPPLSINAWRRLNINWQKLPTLFRAVESSTEETFSLLLSG